LGIELSAALERERVGQKAPPHEAFKGINLQDDLAWKAAAGAVKALPEGERRELLAKLGGQPQPEYSPTQLEAILNSAGEQVAKIGFRDWKRDRTKLKATIGDETVVIVDRDLQRGGGAADEGELILKEIIEECSGVC